MKVLVTGSAGFIGSFVSSALLERGDEVVGLDIVNAYYDPALKEARLTRLKSNPRFVEARIDLADRAAVADLFERHRPQRVINLAAQAGVRYSVENPAAYVDSNLVGFANILEGCRAVAVEHLVFASTSSVYGTNTRMPFSEHRPADHPISLYAATKKANEAMAHAYAHLFGVPCTGLRFFTVYGPWGRPDMALFKFTKAMLERRPLPVFNGGKMRRDFTYVDDIANGVVRLLDRVPAKASPRPDIEDDPAVSATAPYRLYNIGNSKPEDLMRYIAVLEDCLGRKAEYDMLPMQPGDVEATWASVEDLANDTGYRPATPIEVGVRRFVEWYREFYKV